MPARRLPVPLLAFAIVAAATIMPAPTRVAHACPSEPPEPLRLLYKRSDRIVVARVGRAVTVKRDAESSTVLMRTPLEVSATLKGEGDRRAVKLFYSVAADENEEPTPRLDEGDRLLLFLSRSEQGDGYELSRWDHSARKLGDEELEVYTRRIEELGGILQLKEPDVDELVEWLVRCAEEPATRWEGAFDLLMSVEAVQRRAHLAGAGIQPGDPDSLVAEESPPRADAGEVDPERAKLLESLSMEVYLKGLGAEAEFAAHLTESRKERLAAALFDAGRMTLAETLLARLVGSWDDPRLVPFLVAHLRSVAQNPPDYAGELMSIVAEELEDEELLAAAVKFREAYYGADIAEAQEAEAAEGEAGPEAEAAEADDNAAEVPEAADESQPAEVEAGGDEAEKPDPALVRRRGELLQSFLALVESKAGAAGKDEGGRMKDESSLVKLLP